MTEYERGFRAGQLDALDKVAGSLRGTKRHLIPVEWVREWADYLRNGGEGGDNE